MDRKMGAVLAIAIIGMVTGVVGIVMANDAKSNGQTTQQQLDASIAKDEQRLSAQQVAAAAKLKRAEKSEESSVAQTEKTDQQKVQDAANQIAGFQSTIDGLKQQITDLTTAQKQSTQKLNDRITALSDRVGG